MAALPWTVVTALLLVQTSAASAFITETELATIVTQLLNAYRPTYRTPHRDTPTFTLAVSVPYNAATRTYDVNQVTTADIGLTVRTALDNCQVYQGNRVIGATVLRWPDVRTQCPNGVIPDTWINFIRPLCPNANVRTWANLNQACIDNINRGLPNINNQLANQANGAVDHAEYRVLQSFNHLNNRKTSGQLNGNDLLVFYSYKSPCDARCASLENNLSIVRNTNNPNIRQINNWRKHVLVFSQLFVPGAAINNQNDAQRRQQETNRRTALTNLGNAINGLSNIYRCRIGYHSCSRCNAATGVTDACVRD